MSWLTDFITILGVPAALIAAWKAIEEWRFGNAEKVRENRHKQAAAARDALNDIFYSERSGAAMQMLDWSGRSYQDDSAEHTVSFGELGPALRVNNLSFDAKERYIRDCFEDFFDRLELLQHYVSIDFLNFEDVSVPIAYYAKKIAKHMPSFEPFLNEYGYIKAKAFIIRAAE